MTVQPVAAALTKLIMIISAVAGIISLVVVSSVALLAILGRPVPEVLSNWGGIIIGFYFGGFVMLVKDYANILTSHGSATPSGSVPPPAS
jgi:uncharacterized RDD family membrane protein YckC